MTKGRNFTFVEGDYSPLEQNLAEALGVKVLLISDWAETDEYWHASNQLSVTRGPHPSGNFTSAEQQHFEDVEGEMLQSLLAGIALRDPALSDKLCEDSLRALHTYDHFTIREHSAAAPEAVIIFDPASKIERLGLPACLLTKSFFSAWNCRNRPEAENLIENLDITSEDYRAYLALRHTLDALRNPHEYINRGGRTFANLPPYTHLCNLFNDGGRAIGRAAHHMTFEQCQKYFEFECPILFNNLGIEDTHLADKLMYLGAVMNLVNYREAKAPFDTFARMHEEITENEITCIQRNLRQRLEQAFEQKKADAGKKSLTGDCPTDWRVLFPLFRELYEKNVETYPTAAYFDFIWKGLDTYFPTIFNGPVPVLRDDREPPSTLAQYKLLEQIAPFPPSPA